MKKIKTLLLLLIIVASGNQFISSAENYEKLNVEMKNLEVKDKNLKSFNDYFYRKVDVQTYTQMGSYARVSDTINTYGASSGSITCNRSVSYSVEVSGNISGLGISLGGGISSSIGYTLSVGSNRRVYMGYAPVYKVETGYRELYDSVTGKVISRNKYKIKTPIYGEYQLIND